MTEPYSRAIAIVGLGAVLPDAPDVPTFWKNIAGGRYSISDVPTDRWDAGAYYDPDPSVPDKTYSKIGGWVREYTWDPLAWKLPIPPRVSDAMDRTQKWAVIAAREALADAGWPGPSWDNDRTAVIFGNAMAGDLHYRTAMRIHLPEITRELLAAPSFAGLSPDLRQAVMTELKAHVSGRFPEITEDTMPGELANIIAGRVANLFNFHGPNYVTDAACASAMAAFTAAVEGLVQGDYDVVLTGGIDSNMSASTFTKFCKIGALSATGTRPYANGADGFVMGEGAAVFVLKRLADAEKAGDRIYAVIRGMGGSSDGKGKGITAPNPIGQRFAIERGWERAGVLPDTATLIEGHGTSTKVGDVIEVESLSAVFARFGLPKQSLPLGSVKSNIGHLKGSAGSAGILKATLALHHRQLPPSINCDEPNPNIDFAGSPLYVNRELRDWTVSGPQVRRAGVSAFGFGGTNFHAVLEEYVPGLHREERRTVVASAEIRPIPASEPRKPMRGALVLGADSPDALRNRLIEVRDRLAAGRVPEIRAPYAADLRAAERIAIDWGDADELSDRIERALKGFERDDAKAWKVLRGRGIHRGSGGESKTAFLFTGQGSQYANMLSTMRLTVPEVRDTFAEADAVMTPILGKPLSEFVFLDSDDPAAIAEAEEHLRQTEITQPAVLTTDAALTRLLATYGVRPHMVMGHSLGEYGALVAGGALSFGDALRAVSARAHAMREVSMEDNGCMAAVSAPLDELERLLAQVDGYVVIANLNSRKQAVIGGATAAVAAAEKVIADAGYAVRRIAVSHAFHTSIVGPASGPLTRYLESLEVRPPAVPVVANVTGGFYPMDPGARPAIIDLLGRQIASPVQFVKGLQTLHDQGVRTFVEVGPKRALASFVEDVFPDDETVTALFTNHPKTGDVTSFNQALCALYAAGLGDGIEAVAERAPVVAAAPEPPRAATPRAPEPAAASTATPAPAVPAGADDRYVALGRLFAEFLERGFDLYRGAGATPPVGMPLPTARVAPVSPPVAPAVEPLVITGAALGLPGSGRVFDDGNVERILRGDSFIGSIPMPVREAMVAKHITRLVKSEAGGPHFETIDSAADAIKLAGLPGRFDLGDFGVPEERIPALNGVTQLAIAVGLEALRDAGIPLVMKYRTTTKGTFLPDRWMLPDTLRDETGVIFASAFPDSEAWADEVTGYDDDRHLRARLADLESLRAKASEPAVMADLDLRIADLRKAIDEVSYTVDRRLLFRVLSMGHSQFAEYIGARGPNSQVNAACASTPQAIGLAEDWIRQGRCRRVIVISADNVTSPRMLEWIGAGFLASGAAATDERVEDAVLPFDRRRHGMVVGMGAASLVVETAEAARERGIAPICEVLSTVVANSAFHGTRLDVEHIRYVMERLVAQAEGRWGIDRRAIAPRTVFVSHETYTPARGGSAQAEVDALRYVFADVADRIVMANTKGFTGHAMGAGIEDVVAVKALETGLVPPVANFREVDPDLGRLNLSSGGPHEVEFALRLGAGFGSQIAMTLLRRVPAADGPRRSPRELGYAYRVADPSRWAEWLRSISGYEAPAVEVIGRTLRIRDDGPPAAVPADPGRATAPAPLAPSSDGAPAAGPAPIPEPAPVHTGAKTDGVRPRVMEIVAGVTGYPTDMLDPELDLEADLGIDTVKQAETFAAVRAAFDIPREEDLKLRDFPTLDHVVQFVLDRRPDLATAGADVPAAAPTAAPAAAPATARATPVAHAGPAVPSSAPNGIAERVLQIVSDVTGYPPDMLDPDLDLEADLGIDTVKQAETFAAVRAAFDIPRDDALQLREFPTLAHVIRFAEDRAPARFRTAAASPAGPVTAPAAPVPAATAPTTAAAPETDAYVTRVVAIAAEITGYPPDMLDLDLDLEADLGIDTVKQAEMFAAIRAAWGIERDENLQLREFPTLAHVVRFARERSGAPEPEPAPAVAPVHAQDAAPSHPGAPEASAPAPSGSDDPMPAILEFVTELTGYPADMLDPELDLEADLGIDTVKQAEMFAAVRGRWGIERDENLQLRDFPTLADVARFVIERRPDLAGSGDGIAGGGAPSAPGAAPEAATEPAPDSPVATRRVPVVRALPPATRFVTTGVTLDAGARVVLMADRSGVAKALAQRLEKRGTAVLRIDDTPDRETLASRLAAFAADGPVTGVYWLPALDREGDLRSMPTHTRSEALHVRAKLLYTAARVLYDRLEAGSFFIGATRLDGRHGFSGSAIHAPFGGAVTGFLKALRRERPECVVKAVDFAPTRSTADPADRLLEEALYDRSTVEVGYHGGRRCTIAVEERPLDRSQRIARLPQDPVFVVTGAAGSIVSAITADLARTWPGTFWLLDLADRPADDDPDLDAFDRDPESLKRTLFERLKASGERATPARVEKDLAAVERRAAARAAVRAVERAGGTARYASVDLRDAAAVSAVAAKIRDEEGRVDVLLHAAGLEKSRFLPDKEPAEFDLVFDVKTTGYLNLLAGLGDVPIGSSVVFSSIAGRFGNGGQTDYSSANDFLAKVTASLGPDTRGITIDWTAWARIGMASRGSIPTMMARAGIDMLDPDAGIPVVRDELLHSHGGEVVIAESLGLMLEPPPVALADPATGSKPMLGRVLRIDGSGRVTFEAVLDPALLPFLDHHRIEGTPVLPGVMGLEAFVEAARFLQPDLEAVSLESVRFSAPFKFYRDEPRPVEVEAVCEPDGESVLVHCRLVGRRLIAARNEESVTVHFTATVRMAPGPVASAPFDLPDFVRTSEGRDASRLYEVYFHGPAYRVVDRLWRHGSSVAARFASGLPANHPASAGSAEAAPRLVELAFQAAGALEMADDGSMGLPSFIRSVRFLSASPTESAGAIAVARRDSAGAFDVVVSASDGHAVVALDGYRTAALPGGLVPNAAALVRDLAG